jgi:hypothetical protein
MAMQRSDELPCNGANFFSNNLKSVARTPFKSTIGIFREAEGLIEFSVTDWGGEGKKN